MWNIISILILKICIYNETQHILNNDFNFLYLVKRFFKLILTRNNMFYLIEEHKLLIN